MGIANGGRWDGLNPASVRGIPALGDDAHLAREVAAETVQLLLRGVYVPEGELVLRDKQVGEAVGGFGVGFALGLLQLGDCGAASAGDDEGGADALEFDVLQVVVVSAETGGDPPGGVAVRAVAFRGLGACLCSSAPMYHILQQMARGKLAQGSEWSGATLVSRAARVAAAVGN